MNDIRFLDILEAGDNVKEKLRQWRNSKRVSSFMLNQHVITKEEHSKWIEGLRSDRYRKNWVIFIDGNPAGSIYLENINHKKLISEWGFYIGDDAYIGKGLAKPILSKFLELFFYQMGFETLLTKVLAYNTKALSLYKKVGFKELKAPCFTKDDSIICLKFTRQDWFDREAELCNEQRDKCTK